MIAIAAGSNLKWTYRPCKDFKNSVWCSARRPNYSKYRTNKWNMTSCASMNALKCSSQDIFKNKIDTSNSKFEPHTSEKQFIIRLVVREEEQENLIFLRFGQVNFIMKSLLN